MDQEKKKYEREWSKKAVTALSELADVCKSNRPTDMPQMQKKGKDWRTSSGQCKLSILPGDSAEGGTLQVEVRS